MSVNSDISNCIICKKQTSLKCAVCNVPICAKHNYLINRKNVCEACLIKEKKKGLLKQWGIIAFLGIVATLVFIFA